MFNPVTGRYQCPRCEKSFGSRSGLKGHYQDHTGSYTYWCEACKKGFSSRGNFDAHMAKHQGITFPCNRCEKRFSKNGNLLAHYRKAHTQKTCNSHEVVMTGVRFAFACLVGTKFISSQITVCHAAGQHQICSFCDFVPGFSCAIPPPPKKVPWRKRHLCCFCVLLITNPVLKSNPEKMQCLYSTGTLHLQKLAKHPGHSHRNRLDAEMFSMFNPVTGKYQCPRCDKTFGSKHGLRLHCQDHTGSYSYWCETCKKGFTCKGNFDGHMAAKHLGATFPCGRCEKRFCSKGKLQHHCRKTHEGDGNLQPAQCSWNVLWNRTKDFGRQCIYRC